MLLIKYFHFSNLKRPNVIKVRCRAEICITFAFMLSYLQFRFKLAVDHCCNYWKERWADCWCARLQTEGSEVESWPGPLYCVLRKLSYRSGLWHSYWGKIASQLFVFLPSCNNPTSHCKTKLVAKRKSPLHSNFFHFYHLIYWTVYCNVNKHEKRH